MRYRIALLALVLVSGVGYAEPVGATVTVKPHSTVSVARNTAWSRSRVVGIIRREAYAAGLGRADADALVELARRESTWNPNALSRSGRYHGLFQLSAGMAHGHPWRDPAWNTRRAIAYIRGRYGTPRRALAWARTRGWY